MLASSLCLLSRSGDKACVSAGWCISSVTSMEKWKEKLQHLQARREKAVFSVEIGKESAQLEVLSEILERPAEEHRLSVADGYASLVPTIQRMIKGHLADLGTVEYPSSQDRDCAQGCATSLSLSVKDVHSIHLAVV